MGDVISHDAYDHQPMALQQTGGIRHEDSVGFGYEYEHIMPRMYPARYSNPYKIQFDLT